MRTKKRLRSASVTNRYARCKLVADLETDIGRGASERRPQLPIREVRGGLIQRGLRRGHASLRGCDCLRTCASFQQIEFRQTARLISACAAVMSEERAGAFSRSIWA